MFDLIVEGGTVVDGSGGSVRRADVGITGGIIVAIGLELGPATRRVDASGRVVAPGFVDVHTHYDAQAFWDPLLSPSPTHGVTSVVAGNCGFSIAPLKASEGEYLRRMLARVEGMSLPALDAGVPWDWETTAEFLDRLEGRLGINAGFMVGHSAIRRFVMGDEANARIADDHEVERMQAMLAEGLAAGGLGFSSTWATTHSDEEGRPVPSRFADKRELVALSAVCRGFEGTSLEFLPRTPPTLALPDDEFDVMLSMSKAAQRPLNWNIMRVSRANQDCVAERLEVGRRALELGGRIVMLVMPQAPETRFCFRTGFALDAISGWKELLARPQDEKLALLKDHSVRRQMAALAAGDDARQFLTSWSTHVIAETFSPETRGYSGRAVGEIAAAEGKDPFEALLDVVVADDLNTYFRLGGQPDEAEDWALRAEVCRDSRVLIGGSDAGAHLDMICTHNYATNVLANLVRRHGVLTLSEAVHLLTGAPASLYGLRDRGLIKVGYAADLVVFDEETVDAGPARTRFDLPTGAARLCSEGQGIDAVIVNGRVVIAGGEATGERPGRVLRSGRDTENSPLHPTSAAA